MAHTRTTPPRPLDIAAVFPELAPLARRAIRLHPRPGAPTPSDSSVGGPLLWPARHPWPLCERWHEGPRAPLVPVAQLYAGDIPLLRPPGRNDLLQILWCPAEHPPLHAPPVELHWRVAAEVTDPLTDPPRPVDVEFPQYVPVPCLLAPEEITDYPDSMELGEELLEAVADPGEWRARGIDWEEYATPDPYGDDARPEDFYRADLGAAPGWKAGGWAPWGLTDPVPRFCVDCGGRMTPLLTIPSDEWEPGRESWVPAEERALAHVPDAAEPTGVTIQSGHHLQLYVCGSCPWSTDCLVQ
ncbi:hypothetical protein [Streptomyces sp. NPDC047046]|uniref:hypothetical protein n=1 Tax=Streptomyces sp. NPDC047046 TaxID=3155378 RepID=UPI0033C19CB8